MPGDDDTLVGGIELDIGHGQLGVAKLGGRRVGLAAGAVAVGGAVASYSAQADVAVSAGATAAELPLMKRSNQ